MTVITGELFCGFQWMQLWLKAVMFLMSALCTRYKCKDRRGQRDFKKGSIVPGGAAVCVDFHYTPRFYTLVEITNEVGASLLRN